MIFWIHNNLFFGKKKPVANTKKEHMARLEYEEYVKLDNYVGCKNTRIGKLDIKIMQQVVI